LAAKDTQKTFEEQDTESGTPARNRLRAIALLLVVALAAGGGWFGWWYFHARFLVSTEDAFIDAHVVRVAAQEAGKVTALPVEDNMRVTQGAVLAQLDPATVDAEMAQARANLEKAQTGVAAAEADLAQARATVARQESAARAAEVTAENARRHAERYRAIMQKGDQAAISEQELDDAEADAQAAEAQAAEAETAVDEARAGVTAAQAALAAAQADRAVASANLDSVQVKLSHMTITAPMDGTIVQRNVGLGSYVSPGTQMMALVPDDIYVTANFKETQLAGLHPGLPVDIEVDAYPDATFHGELVSIQKGAGQAFQLLPPQNATGNFVKVVQRVPVRISIASGDAGDHVLGPGMSVVPTVHLERP